MIFAILLFVGWVTAGTYAVAAADRVRFERHVTSALDVANGGRS